MRGQSAWQSGMKVFGLKQPSRILPGIAGKRLKGAKRKCGRCVSFVHATLVSGGALTGLAPLPQNQAGTAQYNDAHPDDCQIVRDMAKK